MAKGKAPRHDGILLEFFQKTWSYICIDYHAMFFQGFEEETLHKGINKGLINFILKEGEKVDLKYWRPITLLTAAYKISPRLYNKDFNLFSRT